jgi:autotransporter-associated beta strand protein
MDIKRLAISLFGMRLPRRRKPHTRNGRLRGERLESRRVLTFAFPLGSTGIDYCKDVAVDPAGNVIAAGYFSGTVDFDPGPGVANRSAVGVSDNFLAKYDSQGNHLWSFRTGGAAADLPHSVVVDTAGNIYTAGYFTGMNVDFDPGVGQALRNSNGARDAYVAKYSADGAYQWCVTFGNTAAGNATNDEAYDLRVDSAGNVYVIGSFEGTINVGGSPLVSAGGRDAFLAAYGPSGSYRWSKAFGGSGEDNGYAVAVDSAGNVYAAGGFTANVAVGGASLTNRGGTDIFLAKYDSSGNHLWSQSMGGTTSADMVRPGGLEIDSQNRVYLCGSYGGLADFNPSPTAVNNLTSTGSGNWFLARYEASGAYVWAIGVGGTGTSGPDGAHRMAIDPSGDVFVTGFFTDQNVDFDPGPGTALLSSRGTGAGTTDVFVARYTPLGSYVWARGFGDAVAGSDLFSLGGGIEVEPGGTVLVAGRQYGTIDYAPANGSKLVASAGQSDGFLVRLDRDGLLFGVPTNVTLSPASIAEDLPIGSAIGSLSTADPDAGDRFTYALVPGGGDSGNGSFTIVGDELRTADILDFESQAAYSIRVRTTDSGGLFFERVLVVTVADAAEDSILDVVAGETLIAPSLPGSSARLVKRGAGTLILDAATGCSGGTVIEAGTVIVRTPLACARGTVTVKSGAILALDVDDSLIPLERLVVEPGGYVDFGSGSITVAPGGITLSEVEALLAAGAASGWVGSGFGTRWAGHVPGGGLGWLAGDGGALTIGFAAIGDVNLDGVVDVLDIADIVSAGRYDTASPASWAEGDSNYDGVVDILDVAALLASGHFDRGRYGPASASASSPRYSPATEVALGARDDSTGIQPIRFTLSWANSWRTDINYDALWIFVKYRRPDGPWQHATLSAETVRHSTGSAGSAATLVPAADGRGAFFHRSISGAGIGAFSSRGVEIGWAYAADGVPFGQAVEVAVHAIEMVLVPEGAFSVGDGTDGSGDPGNVLQGQLRRTESNSPFVINSEAALTLGGRTAGNLTSSGGATPPDDFNVLTVQQLPAAYPKGYQAFWCMKHELTQGQYVDFLNSLTYDQQAGVTRQLTATPQYASVSPSAAVGTKAITTPQGNSSFRNFVEIATPGVPGGLPAVYGVDADENSIYDEPADGGSIACGYLTWLDGCAYADWAGLRPMSQLEFEKACRGNAQPLANEFAWGTNVRIAATGLVNPGTAREAAANAEANVCAANLIQGPVRVGMFQKPGRTRAQSGATYYGILDMSGNVWERVAGLGRQEGRSFVPNHGDGSITASGYADVAGWTGNVGGVVSSGVGTGFVGGNFFRTEDFNGVYFNYALLRTSGRLYGNTADSVRFSGNGFRCVRSA